MKFSELKLNTVLASPNRILLIKKIVKNVVLFKVVNFEERWIDITPFSEREDLWDKFFHKSYRPINQAEKRLSIMRVFKKSI